jgi:hypothetical protein
MPAVLESYVASSTGCLQSPSPLETPVDHFVTSAFHHHQPQHHALPRSFDLPQPLHLFADDGARTMNTPYILEKQQSQHQQQQKPLSPQSMMIE